MSQSKARVNSLVTEAFKTGSSYELGYVPLPVSCDLHSGPHGGPFLEAEKQNMLYRSHF